MKWYLSRGGKAEGPFPEEHVAHWLKSTQISPETLACAEGGQEWKRLDEIDAFVRFVRPPAPSTASPPPPPPPGTAPVQSSSRADTGQSPQARFGSLFAAIALSGIVLLLDVICIGDTGETLSGGAIIIGFCVAVGCLIAWAVFHYGLWQLLPEQFRETIPGKAVGFLFIPFFNCYWVFRSYMGVNRGLNRLAEANGLPPPRANVGLATAAAVFFVVAVFFTLLDMGLPTFEDIESQYIIRDQVDLQNAYNDVVATQVVFDIIVLLVASIPGFVVWLLMVLNQKRMVEHLLAHGVPLDRSSNLLPS